MTTNINTELSWSKDINDVLSALAVDATQGLAEDEVIRRQTIFGSNKLLLIPPTSAWSILLRQFNNIMMLFLFVAAALSLLFHEYPEAISILCVILVSVFMGFIMELNAVRSMEALKKLSDISARVFRGGNVHVISASNLVPGDLVQLESGDVVPADARIISLSRLQVNESMLTGESEPRNKSLAIVARNTLLADRNNMLYSGTYITRGSATVVVVATGMHSELGKIAELVSESNQEQKTPLERRLINLSKRLVVATLFITCLVTLLGIYHGMDTWVMVETGIALAVATIPEGLPVVATIAMARGMWRMAKNNALINRLAAVETLGVTSIICTDKTGTLTENRMMARQLVTSSLSVQMANLAELSDRIEVIQAMQIAALCNNATTTGIGDPMEVALQQAAKLIDMSIETISKKYPRLEELAFDEELRLMATLNQHGDQNEVLVKGAPEEVISRCQFVLSENGVVELDSHLRQQWESKNVDMATSGLRVLALAKKVHTKPLSSDAIERLTLVALVGLQDPPRDGIRQAVDLCQQAGLEIVMVTGDQANTAKAIALETGIVKNTNIDFINGDELDYLLSNIENNRSRLLGCRIFSRVTPQQKLHLVRFFQENGYVVAMTGDGVNDAPALKSADIGIAMGKRGTQVAREAADMVLKDDSFASIVSAIEQGRIIFNNLRRFVIYLMSCNLSEVLIIGLTTAMGLPLPLLPLQILFLNLVTDVYPALALGMCRGHRNIMQQKPRGQHEDILSNQHWLIILAYGLLLTGSVLGVYIVAHFVLRYESQLLVSMSFATLALAQLFHVFNMRHGKSNIFNNDVLWNPYIWGALLLCIGLILLAMWWPSVSAVLHLQALTGKQWLWVVIAASIPTLIIQTAMLIGSKFKIRGFIS